MKNKSLLAGLFMCTLSILPVAAQAQSLKTVEANLLTAGSDMTWPPFAYFDNHTPAGFDIELMEKISVQIGIKSKVVDTRFASLIIGLTGGKFDLVTTLYITPARAKQVDYVPYFKTGGVLMTRQGSTYRPQTMQDLCGKKAANLKGAAWFPTLEKISANYCIPNRKGAITIQEYETSQLAAQALLAGVADVQFDDAAVAQTLIGQTQGRLQISSTALLEPVVVGLAVAKGNQQMVKRLEDALTALRSTGEYQALLARYGLEEPSAEDIAAAYAGG